VLGWHAWPDDRQRLSKLAAPRTYLVHARAIHLATVVQAVLAKLEYDYPCEA
jgi:hypothetical protein